MEDWLVRGFVTGCYAILCDFFSSRKAKNLRVKILRSHLLNSDYKWRNLKQLARAIGQTPGATRDLLIEIGARRSAGENDVWTLEQ